MFFFLLKHKFDIDNYPLKLNLFLFDETCSIYLKVLLLLLILS